MPHQAQVLSDNHKFIGNFGGFGSAKTYTSRQLVYKQVFLNPNGLILIGANISRQYEQTIQKEIAADIPKAMVKSWSQQKQSMEFYNGCKIIYSPFDDVGKLRSMNLSAWVMVEGSEVDPEAFTQLKSRLRNMNAANVAGYDPNGKPIYEHFRGKGIVESNPEQGWLRDEFLDTADAISQHGTAMAKYEPDPNKRDPAISVHISSSDSNIFLPDGYIRDLCKNKPDWWIERYVYGSFEFANGLCCPSWKDNIVPAFEPPAEWTRLIAHDPGLVDPSAFVSAAVDDKEGVVYIYRDLQYKDLSVPELYERWQKEIAYDLKQGQLYTPPIMDGKMHGRRMFTDKKTLDQMWAEYGVYFQPGHIPVKDRIWRMNAYFKSGRVKIMDNCENLKREFKDYKYKVPKPGQPYKEEPYDRNNHSIDAFSWILMKLPADPHNLMCGAYSRFGEDLTTNPKKAIQVDPLWMFSENTQDDDDALWDMDV